MPGTVEPMGLAIPPSSCMVCTLVSDGHSRGPSVPTLNQAVHADTCPVLQGAGLVLEAADIGCSVLSKAQAGRKGGARSKHSLEAQQLTSQLRKEIPSLAARKGEGDFSSNSCPPSPNTHLMPCLHPRQRWFCKTFCSDPTACPWGRALGASLHLCCHRR